MWWAILVLVFAIAILGAPLPGEGWFWEFGNALGFLALAFLLILLANGRGGLGRSLRHRWLGIAALLATLVHISWFLIGDSLSLEYIKWGAPHYMVAGVFSAGLLILITFSSLVSFRNRSFHSYRAFRSWHHWLSVLALILAAIHVILSGFYFIYWWQAVLLVVLLLMAYFQVIKKWSDSSFSQIGLLVLSALIMMIFVFFRSSSIT